MPLVDLSMVEQRYDAVREVLDGATVKDTATRYGIDRRTLHRWLVRYATDGLAALADKSSKPDRCPHQMPPEVEARIVEMRRSHPGWGPRTILNKLRREQDHPPSRAAIYRCLVRHRLISPKPRRRRRDDYKRWERSRSMELWQIDVMGSVVLTNGIGVSIVTGIDDHSRFCVIAKIVERATARPVCEALLEALDRHGTPEQILTDNGKVFTGRLGRRPATVLFDRICLNNGIRHLLTAPYSPTTTGKIERLHKTMRKEFFSDNSFDSIAEMQAAWTSGSPPTTTSASTRASATCRRSGASSSLAPRRSRSSTAMSSPSRNTPPKARSSPDGSITMGASASSSTAITSGATSPAKRSRSNQPTGCFTSHTTVS